MHSPAKEALGKDVKDAWGKAKEELPKPIAVARANYEGIHTRQLTSLDELKGFTRDSLLLQTAVGYDRTVEQQIASLQKAAGVSSSTHPCSDVASGYCSFTDTDFWKSYGKLRLALKNNRDSWASMNATTQRAVGKALPTCEAWTEANGKAKKPWLELVSKNEILLGELSADAAGVTQVCTEMVANQLALQKLLQTSAPAKAPASERDAAIQALFGTATIPTQMQKVVMVQ